MRTAMKHEQAAGELSPATDAGSNFIRCTSKLGGTTTRWALQATIADPRLSFTYVPNLPRLHLGKIPAGQQLEHSQIDCTCRAACWVEEP